MVGLKSFINKIDHIGIAVKDINKSLIFYTDILGLKLIHSETVYSEHVKIAFLSVGEVCIELLQPINDKSPIQKFINHRGEGVHHIAFYVTDIHKQFAELKGENIQIINDGIKRGARNKYIFFIHPRDASGVLYEFCAGN